MSPARPPRGEGLRLALWTHQLVEYLLGALIVLQSINGGRAAPYIAAAGGLLFLVAALTDGPCAVARWIPAGPHRVLDVIVIIALVLAPIVSGTTEFLAWALCLLAAAALIWLHWHTDWTRPVRRATRATATDPADPAPSRAPSPGSTSPKPTSIAESARALGATVDRTTRGASRAAGRIYGRSRARRTDGGEKTDRDA